MEQNKIQQKLLSFDISSLTSNDDFSKVFELLSQLEDKDFIQYIQQKLENNLAFKDFAKNQPDLVSSLNRENNHSSRLAGLVSERQKESNLKATSSIGSRTILQQQIQNIIFGGAYIEGIKQAFDLDFSFGLKTSNELLQKLLNQGNLEDSLNVGATSLENILSSPDKIVNNQELLAITQSLVNKVAVESSRQGNTESATKAATQSEIYSIVQKDPKLSEQINKTINFNALKHNSKENIFKDSCTLEEAVKTVKLFGKQENLESLKNEYIKEFGKEEGEKHFKEVKENIQKKFETDLIEFAAKKATDRELAIKDFNSNISLLMDGISSIYLADEDDPVKLIEGTIKILSTTTEKLEVNGFSQIINDQIFSMSLYYINAKREMEENPDKYPSFIDFFNSEEGKKGAGREFFNNPLIEKFIAIRKLDEIGGTSYEQKLMTVLRIPPYLLDSAMEVNQLLTKEANQRNIKLEDILIEDSEKKITTYAMPVEDENIIEHKWDLNGKAEKENSELYDKNPNWEKKLEQEYNSKKNKQNKNSENLENTDIKDDFLNEDNLQVKKEDAKRLLLDTTETFIEHKDTIRNETYKHSI